MIIYALIKDKYGRRITDEVKKSCCTKGKAIKNITFDGQFYRFYFYNLDYAKAFYNANIGKVSATIFEQTRFQQIQKKSFYCPKCQKTVEKSVLGICTDCGNTLTPVL